MGEKTAGRDGNNNWHEPMALGQVHGCRWERSKSPATASATRVLSLGLNSQPQLCYPTSRLLTCSAASQRLLCLFLWLMLLFVAGGDHCAP